MAKATARQTIPSGAERLTFASLCEQPELEHLQHVLCEDFNAAADTPVYFFRGNQQLKGDLYLDPTAYGDEECAMLRAGDGVVYAFGGDLQLRGSLINRSPDEGVSLLVAGNLVAKHAVFGGASGYVHGDIQLRGTGLSHHSDGAIESTGAVKAKLLIHHDSQFPGVPGKRVRQLTWGAGGDRDLVANLRSDLKSGSAPKIDELIEAILKGETLLDPTVLTVSQRIDALLALQKKGEPVPLLSLNKEKKFPAKALKLHSLRAIDVSKSSFEVPAGFDQLTQLEEIVATKAFRFARALPKFAASLRGLKRLHIDPADWSLEFCVFDLEELHVGKGGFLDKNPGEELTRFERLRHLGLNDVPAIPEFFPQLKALESLDLHFREKKDIEFTVPALSKLPKLRRVRFEANKYLVSEKSRSLLLDRLIAIDGLRSLCLLDWVAQPAELAKIATLGQLEQLELPGQAFRGIPDWIYGLSQLQHLDLRNSSVNKKAREKFSRFFPGATLRSGDE